MIIMRFPEGKSKALTLSYDDGVEQDRTLLDILNAAGLKCTFNLNSGCFPPEGHVWPEGQIHRRMTRSAVQRKRKRKASLRQKKKSSVSRMNWTAKSVTAELKCSVLSAA